MNTKFIHAISFVSGVLALSLVCLGYIRIATLSEFGDVTDMCLGITFPLVLAFIHPLTIVANIASVFINTENRTKYIMLTAFAHTFFTGLGAIAILSEISHGSDRSNSDSWKYILSNYTTCWQYYNGESNNYQQVTILSIAVTAMLQWTVLVWTSGMLIGQWFVENVIDHCYAPEPDQAPDRIDDLEEALAAPIVDENN